MFCASRDLVTFRDALHLASVFNLLQPIRWVLRHSIHIQSIRKKHEYSPRVIATIQAYMQTHLTLRTRLGTGPPGCSSSNLCAFTLMLLLPLPSSCRITGLVALSFRSTNCRASECKARYMPPTARVGMVGAIAAPAVSVMTLSSIFCDFGTGWTCCVALCTNSFAFVWFVIRIAYNASLHNIPWQHLRASPSYCILLASVVHTA